MVEDHPTAESKRQRVKGDRELEKTIPRTAFVAKLRKLADSIERGERFRIQIGGERLSIPVQATFSIEHEREGTAQEIDFQIQWDSK